MAEIVDQLPSHPAAASIFSVLAVVHAHREQWLAAVKNYSKVVEFRPTDHEGYHYLAPVLVQAGDLEAYRRHCERILRQFAATTNPVVAERMATARAEGKLPRRYLHYHPGVAHPVIELDRC